MNCDIAIRHGTEAFNQEHGEDGPCLQCVSILVLHGAT